MNVTHPRGLYCGNILFVSVYSSFRSFCVIWNILDCEIKERYAICSYMNTIINKLLSDLDCINYSFFNTNN